MALRVEAVVPVKRILRLRLSVDDRAMTGRGILQQRPQRQIWYSSTASTYCTRIVRGSTSAEVFRTE